MQVYAVPYPTFSNVNFTDCGATGGAVAGGIMAFVELNKIAKQHAEQIDKVANSDLKKATNATTNVEQKPIDDVKKSKLSLQNIFSGIKNLVSKLFKKITSLVNTLCTLNKEQLAELAAVAAAGLAAGTAVGSVIPGIGNAVGGTIGAAVMVLVKLNRIAKENEERLNAINDQAQQDKTQAQAAAGEGQGEGNLAAAIA
jgi:hypothetical protein